MDLASGSLGTTTPSSGNYYNAGSSVPVTANPGSGWVFQSWAGPVANASAASTTVTMSAPTAVTATFVRAPSILFQSLVDGSASTKIMVSIDGGTPKFTPFTMNLLAGPHTVSTVATQSGNSGTQYVFTGWGANVGNGGAITISGTTDTYTASFATQYQLTVGTASGGSVSAPASGGYYASGAAVTITAVPSAGYAFSSWSSTGPGTLANAANASTTLTMGAGVQKITPVFVSLSGITVLTNPSGLKAQITVNGIAQSTFPANLAPGSTPTISVDSTQTLATDPAGVRYVFTGWEDNSTNPSRLITVGTAAAIFTASFAKQVLVTAKPLPSTTAGSVSLSPVSPTGDGYYNAGTSLKATATAASGYIFSTFGGNLGTTNPAIFAANTPTAISANFVTAVTPALAFNVSGGGTANPGPSWITFSISTSSTASVTVQSTSLTVTVVSGTGTLDGSHASNTPHTINSATSLDFPVDLSIVGTVKKINVSYKVTATDSAGNPFIYTGSRPYTVPQ